MTAPISYKSGYVSIIGLPNVGKSTLLNCIIGEKISIVSPKPHTTRNVITGIKTLPDAQIIFMDTPGIYKSKNMSDRQMIRHAKEALKGMDVIAFVIDPKSNFAQNAEVIKHLSSSKIKTILLINKIDLIQKPEILIEIQRYSELYPFDEIIPISALKNDGIDIFLNSVKEYLPFGNKIYPDDLITDSYERFMVAEIIREKIMLYTFDEVPYSVSVEIINWVERADNIIAIKANIYVQKDGQKGILIGKSGEMLKSIGISARKDIEKLLATKAFLQLWVKVKKDCRRDVKFKKGWDMYNVN